MLAQPVAAQERNTLPELEALIPDSAVDNPEDWARQEVPAESVQPDVQPDTPLADLPLIAVPWPEQLDALIGALRSQGCEVSLIELN